MSKISFLILWEQAKRIKGRERSRNLAKSEKELIKVKLESITNRNEGLTLINLELSLTTQASSNKKWSSSSKDQQRKSQATFDAQIRIEFIVLIESK